MKNLLRLLPFSIGALAFAGGLALFLLPAPARATVPSSTAWLQVTLSTNPQTIPVTFVFGGSSDLLVLDSKASPPVVLVLNSDYSVSGGSGSTGSVATIAGGTNAVQVGDVITVTRRVALTQTTTFANTGPLTAAMIGNGLDKLTQISQQLNVVGANSLQFQPDEQISGVLARTARANNLLGFDSSGRVKYYATPGTGGVGTVTNVATGTGLTGGPITSTGTIAVADTAVTPGTYATANITVDQQGRLTAASAGAAVTNIVTGTGLTGGPITSTGTIAMANTAVVAGSYVSANITVDAQGRITSATDGLSDVQIYTSTGAATWTKPTKAKVVFVFLISGGGGGGSGRRGAAGSNRGGGGGGGGGSATYGYLPASLVGATETVTVGAGGQGGAAVLVDSTDGNNGTTGGATSFGSWLNAGGSNNFGAGGTTSGGAAGSGQTGAYPGQAGAAGQVGSPAAQPTAADPFAGGGGGGGGGITSGDAVCFNISASGGNGSSGTIGSGAANGGAAVAGATGNAGGSVTVNFATGGGGGSGGWATLTTVGRAGGAGGRYGGAGGGGTASVNGNSSGAGGTGADGIAIVVSLF